MYKVTVLNCLQQKKYSHASSNTRIQQSRYSFSYTILMTIPSLFLAFVFWSSSVIIFVSDLFLLFPELHFTLGPYMPQCAYDHALMGQGNFTGSLEQSPEFILSNINRRKRNKALTYSFYGLTMNSYILSTHWNDYILGTHFRQLVFLKLTLSCLEFSPLVNKQREVFK